jgi:glycine cleavage system H protein
MKIPENLKYTKDHEWVSTDDGDAVKIGITHHAQDALGDVVFVELPAVGAPLKAHQTFGIVESIKAVSELFSPISGTVTEINSSIVEEPGVVNSDPYGRGWMIRVSPADKLELEELLCADQYSKLVESAH